MPPAPQTPEAKSGSFGPNAWLVDDMFARFKADSNSVSDAWREFFADYTPVVAPSGGATKATVVEVADDEVAVALRGAAARIVDNMEASLGVPTATSFRSIPARLLEVNRQLLNEQLTRTSGEKVSFTHLIGYAVVQGLKAMPNLNATFVSSIDEKGTHGVVRHEHVGLGLAVDVQKSDGSRTLVVPCIKEADTFDFRGFLHAYEDLVRKVHANTADPSDYAGVTVSLTNVGGIGTVQSVPRLMPGQGAIIGVGAINYPAGFEAADPRVLADLGIGRVVTMTSTYDHRIIQGAESGLFLKYVSECLSGHHGFYQSVFSAMGIPYDPRPWGRDHQSIDPADDTERIEKQLKVASLINLFRVRGHL